MATSKTRQRILQAGKKEFADRGYSGARVDAVCKRARANPRMLYHYFGDKDGLYVTVLEHVLGDLRREELELEVDHVAALGGMLQLFDFIHGHFGSHPELIPLLSGENLLKARFLRRSAKTPIVAAKVAANSALHLAVRRSPMQLPRHETVIDDDCDSVEQSAANWPARLLHTGHVVQREEVLRLRE